MSRPRLLPPLALALLSLAAPGCSEAPPDAVAPLRLDLRACLRPGVSSPTRACGPAIEQRYPNGLSACLALRVGKSERTALPLLLADGVLQPQGASVLDLGSGAPLSLRVFVLQPEVGPEACAEYRVDTPCERGGDGVPATCLMAFGLRTVLPQGDEALVITYGDRESPCALECNDECPLGDPACPRVCFGSQQPAAELCNGRDDDCDGDTDEGFELGAPCDAPGTCGAGTWECACGPDDACAPDPSAELRWRDRRCSSEPGGSLDASTAERCNGVDDDCDGETDEDFALEGPQGQRLGLGSACVAQGACGRAPGEVECIPDDPQRGTVRCSSDPGGSAYSPLGPDEGGREFRCNGEDDDCDGVTDEGYDLGGLCDGAGAAGSPCGPGVWECVPDSRQRRCSTGPGGSADQSRAETCDGIDEDCDGEVDEGLGLGDPCEAPGHCGAGVWRCAADGALECSSLDAASPETCNGLDDDCDGRVDEDWPDLGSPCQGQGTCPNGSRICAPEGAGSCCSADPECSGVLAGTERCNGVDDDCDGETDEDFALDQACDGVGGQGSPCGPGLWECDPATLERRCSSHPGGSDAGDRPETCNARDDDCDGEVDEGVAMPPAALHEGVCVGLRQRCVDGEPQEPDPSDLPGWEQVEATCDGLDNDCDGQTDQDDLGGLEAPLASQQQGVCAGAQQVCGGEDGWQEPDLRSIGGWEPAETRCDGRDNDCDGQVDEGLGLGEPCQLPGVCGRGLRRCGPAARVECSSIDAASEETCDEVDNDCDGLTDEDWADLGLPCDGAGACARGSVICNLRGELPSPTCCSADPLCTGQEAPPERCNGLDDDCDGAVDEGFDLGQGCPALGDPSSPCDAGRWECDGQGRDRICSTWPGGSADASGAEECNGRDDDCDGQVDEAEDDTPLSQPCYAGPAGTEGRGICRSGLQACEQGGWGQCLDQRLPEPERCNGVDDDCDGLVDEDDDGAALQRSCYSGPADTEDRGICHGGQQTCAGGRWGECQGQQLPEAETCDGQDQDCDGLLDEGEDQTPLGRACYSGPAGTEGRGQCHGGRQLCAQGEWGACAGEVLPGAETCDGQDQDCDGLLDEAADGLALRQTCYDGPAETAGQGICHAGEQSCQGGQWAPCQGQQLPQEESCNDQDDDCDGLQDEGDDDAPLGRACYDGPAGTEGRGLCAGGRQTCSAGLWSGCAGQTLPAAETCDGQDQDCDGQVDEDLGGAQLTRACYSGPAGTVGVGLCRSGTQTCAAGQWAACAGETLPSAERCDSLDNDCNGATDDAAGGAALQRACYQGAAGTQDVGICHGGTQTCAAGDWGDCLGQQLPVQETCNSVDDDCDGTADDNLGITRCGVGICEHDQSNCVGGQMVACNPLQGAVAEVFGNGLDDDCDGAVDESPCAVGESYWATSGHCYRLVASSLKWTDARDSCGALGGFLAVISEAGENSHVDTVAADNSVWIGLNDRSDEDTWVWVGSDGQPGYRNWNSGEPNDGGWFTAEDCVEMRSDGKWNDLDCDDEHYFVCERVP